MNLAPLPLYTSPHFSLYSPLFVISFDFSVLGCDNKNLGHGLMSVFDITVRPSSICHLYSLGWEWPNILSITR